jgi:hypothetical protein
MTVPAKPEQTALAQIETILVKGDLSKATDEQRLNYYRELCKSIGLNPLTSPFEYIVLNGKLRLYAKRDAADQLRKLNGISIKIISQEEHNGLFTIHVHATDKTGREDEDLGVVAMGPMVKGEARANLILKAITKAKRRVTLSISGLGFLDETEVEDIPDNAKREPPQPAPNVMVSLPPQAHSDVVSTDRWKELDRVLADAAKRGTAVLQTAWMNLNNLEKKAMKAALDRRYKPTAEEADQHHEEASDEASEANEEDQERDGDSIPF